MNNSGVLYVKADYFFGGRNGSTNGSCNWDINKIPYIVLPPPACLMQLPPLNQVSMNLQPEKLTVPCDEKGNLF